MKTLENPRVPSRYLYNSTTPNLPVECCLEIWQSTASSKTQSLGMTPSCECMKMKLQCHGIFESRLLQLAIPGSKLKIQNLSSLNNRRVPSDHICKSTVPNMQVECSHTCTNLSITCFLEFSKPWIRPSRHMKMKSSTALTAPLQCPQNTVPNLRVDYCLEIWTTWIQLQQTTHSRLLLRNWCK